VNTLSRAINSSVVAGRLRRLAAGSAVCAAILAVTRWPDVMRWCRQTRQRIVIGVGGDWSTEREIRTVEQLDVLVSTSVIAAGISSLVAAPIAAWREAGLRRVWDRMLGLDVPTKVRTASVAIIVAVLCHTVLLVLLRVPVHMLGWSMRAVLVAAGAVAFRQPGALAAAWSDKQTS